MTYTYATRGVMETAFIAQMIANGLVLGLYYALLASGFNLIFGIARIFNFAHGDMLMFGAYVTWVIVTRVNLNYGVGILAAVVAIALMGVIFNNYIYKPVRRNMYASFMVACGLALALPSLALIIFGERGHSVPKVFPGSLELLGAIVSWERVIMIIASTVVICGLFLFINRTRTGKAMRAVAYNPDVAALQGINVERIYLTAFVAGAVLAALAGGIISPLYAFVPASGGLIMFEAMVVVILGGLGSVPGAVVGGLILGFIESFGVSLLGYEAVMIAWLAIIVLLIFRPWGLLGKELA
jgi:branched-chain amino acid transport system permease protein